MEKDEKTFSFVCPVDENIKLDLPYRFHDFDRHCTTTKENHKCFFIKLGCTGCTINKQFWISRITANPNFWKELTEKLVNLKSKTQ